MSTDQSGQTPAMDQHRASQAHPRGYQLWTEYLFSQEMKKVGVLIQREREWEGQALELPGYARPD